MEVSTMHDSVAPNILKSEFSRKVIQLRSLVAIGQNISRKDPTKKYQLMLVTPSGMITGDYCEPYCSDAPCTNEDNDFIDISKINELANKVLIDAESELINIKLVDNAAFIKFKNATIKPIGQGDTIELDQIIIYADQVTAFSLIEVK